jgi:hypothetical protein
MVLYTPAARGVGMIRGKGRDCIDVAAVNTAQLSTRSRPSARAAGRVDSVEAGSSGI